VCKIMVQPPDCPTCDKPLDVGLAQITVGTAWWYREYAVRQSENRPLCPYRSKRNLPLNSPRSPPPGVRSGAKLT
jgi:hypothetical protein